MKKWVITDIHGCASTFGQLLERIAFNREDTLYLLGDYIDRGPDSKGVLDLIIELIQSRHQVHCLMGNHEFMMLKAREEPSSREAYYWVEFNGGKETLLSFDALSPEHIDSKYIDFIEGLDYYREVDQHILVHAGLNLAIDDPLSDQDAMLWIRGDQKINRKWLAGRTIIHGHTPQAKKQVVKNVRRAEKYPIVGIDCGCVYPREDHHHLCALELQTHELVFQKNIDVY